MAKFREILQNQRQKAPLEKEYQGIKIIEWSAEVPPMLEKPLPPTETEPSPQEKRSPDDIPELPPVEKPQSLRVIQIEEETKTLPLKELEPVVESESGIALALLPGFLVISTNSAASEEFIDNQKNSQAEKNSLADTPEFQRTLKHPQFSRSLIAAYLNFNAAIQLDLTSRHSFCWELAL
ncbi:MAG: DUF3352 domain-containing protein [Oscillatoriaceae bacterium SKW80]|nr:DUF3352 domain-containing protein [Oscillatoriaceae bacterium SKYG93]MCX8119295.1 DUF3352 domain-containing protein [Oscillatoriaceae bacterium SKW80]MDW8454762.1 DUF3352 domain-containing protein [Oscillatoriaceae cyanobacterium SKYGB_i_bin93]HIK28457.1 DUF3352 domain-containing protein [Oscillatoriaceae cyanobacterium M7585_C2015_266]